MKVEKWADCSAQEIFSIILDSLLLDYRQTTDKKAEREDLVKGLTYFKELTTSLGVKVKTRVEITEMESPHLYEVCFTNGDNRNILRYELTEQGNGTLISRSEEFVSTSFADKWNQRVMQFLFRKRLKNRAELHLKKLLEEAEGRRNVRTDI